MTFDEARGQIAAALDVPFAQRQLARFLADARARIPVTIDRAAVARVLLFPAGGPPGSPPASAPASGPPTASTAPASAPRPANT